MRSELKSFITKENQTPAAARVIFRKVPNARSASGQLTWLTLGRDQVAVLRTGKHVMALRCVSLRRGLRARSQQNFWQRWHFRVRAAADTNCVREVRPLFFPENKERRLRNQVGIGWRRSPER